SMGIRAGEAREMAFEVAAAHRSDRRGNEVRPYHPVTDIHTALGDRSRRQGAELVRPHQRQTIFAAIHVMRPETAQGPQLIFDVVEALWYPTSWPTLQASRLLARSCRSATSPMTR